MDYNWSDKKSIQFIETQNGETYFQKLVKNVQFLFIYLNNS